MENQSNEHANPLNAKRGGVFLVTLTLMSMAGLVGTDVYLPMLPEIGNALSVNMETMQLTLSVYLLGLSFGQLFIGPLTERFGRKNLLLICMGVYCLASLACAFSTSIHALLVFRFLQSIGACAGLVIGRAIIGDIYEPKEAGKIFATIFPFVGMSPAISPAIGGVIGHFFSWHANFLFIALFAISVFLLVGFNVPETLTKKQRKPLHLMTVLTAYPAILSSRQFIQYAIAPCAAYIALFSYIAQSPFIFYAHGYHEQAIGLFYITLSITYLLGGFYSKRLLQKNTIDEIIAVGYRYFMLGAGLFLICGWLHLPLFFMIASISILTLGNGFLIPLGTAGVVSSFSGRIGYASGLLGFLQLGVAALTTSFIGAVSLNQVDRLAVFIFVVSTLSSGLFGALAPKKIVEPA